MVHKKCGVVIGRFQVPCLTEGHKTLINTALSKSDKVLLLIGEGKVNSKNPLSYEMRYEMIAKTFAKEYEQKILIISFIHDRPEDDYDWVRSLDARIDIYDSVIENPTLFGGRDSFIDCYKLHLGKYPTEYVNTINNVSGTDLRAKCFKSLPKYSYDIASAIIWATKHLEDDL
jgi:hypothetical protein